MKRPAVTQWWVARWAELSQCAKCRDFGWSSHMLPARALDGSLHHPSCSALPTDAERRAAGIQRARAMRGEE